MSPGLRDEFDEPESDEKEDDDLLDEQEVAAAQDREQWGPFVLPPGWHVLPAPAVDNGGWGHLLPDYRWTNKRLAHICTTMAGTSLLAGATTTTPNVQSSITHQTNRPS